MNQIWFGIPGKHMQWCPAPLAGAEARNVNYAASIAFENGGTDVTRSKQYHKVYDFSFTGLTQDLEGIGVYNKFASGFYGDGLFYFSDPYAWQTNLFPAAWASPALIEQGWQNIYDTTPAFLDTPANIYNQPPRYPQWSITTAADTFPTNPGSSVYIAIPPGYRLGLGASGYATAGTPRMLVQRIASNGTTSLVRGSLLDPEASARMSVYVDGDNFEAVRICLGRSTSATTTLSLVSMMAQLWKVGTSFTEPNNHFAGEGHTGLEFADDARVETYTYMYPPRKGMSTTLVEVGAWR